MIGREVCDAREMFRDCLRPVTEEEYAHAKMVYTVSGKYVSTSSLIPWGGAPLNGLNDTQLKSDLLQLCRERISFYGYTKWAKEACEADPLIGQCDGQRYADR